MSGDLHRPLNVLLFGWTNLNVIDGSSFFITSLADSLSLSAQVRVDILLATPLRRSIVLDEILGKSNVRILDPFRDTRLGIFDGPDDSSTSITYRDAAHSISFYASRDHHDAIIIRSTEVAAELVRLRPDLAGRTLLYVTGLSHIDSKLDRAFVEQIRALSETEVQFTTQTQQMHERFLEEFGGVVPPGRAHVLSPMVADDGGGFEEAFIPRSTYSRFSYTGKFVDLWYPDKILAGFKQARFMRPELTLDVAGDQFKHSPSNPLFPANTKHMLENSAGVTWHGGLPRRDAREIIRNSDVGISWRSPALDSSLELSTKLLEYGIRGKPCIVNRTEMHEELLGRDYSLFANNMREFVNLLVYTFDYPSVVEEAARASYEASQRYSINQSHANILSILFQLPGTRSGVIATSASGGDGLLASTLIADPNETGTLLDLLATEKIIRVEGKGPYLTIFTESTPLSPSETFKQNLRSEAGTRLSRIFANEAPIISMEEPGGRGARYGSEEDQKIISSLQFEVRNLRERSNSLLREKEIALSATNRDVAEISARLQALRNSKLGRIQRWIWRRRR